MKNNIENIQTFLREKLIVKLLEYHADNVDMRNLLDESRLTLKKKTNISDVMYTVQFSFALEIRNGLNISSQQHKITLRLQFPHGELLLRYQTLLSFTFKASKSI